MAISPDPDLFHCETLEAELTVRGCLVNQGRGQVEPESVYRHCVVCEYGRMLRKTSGLALPVVTMGANWRPEVKGSALTAQGRMARLQAGKSAEQLTPRRQDAKKPARPGKNYPDREAQGIEMKPKPVAKLPQVETSAILGPNLAAGPQKMCPKHPERPQYRDTGLCRECNQAKVDYIPQEKMAAARQKSGEVIKAACDLYRRFQDGEVVEKQKAFALIFAEVAEIKPLLEASAEYERRSLAAEIAVRLRQTFPELNQPGRPGAGGKPEK